MLSSLYQHQSYEFCLIIVLINTFFLNFVFFVVPKVTENRIFDGMYSFVWDIDIRRCIDYL